MRRAFTQLYCHLVWATWDRDPFIRPEWEARLYGAIDAKARELKCVPIAIGGAPDHVHVVVQFPPVVAISYLVQQVKGASSHLVSHEIAPRTEFKWGGGYGAFTIARDDVPAVVEYVRGQKEHHRVAELWEDLERMECLDEPMPYCQ